MLTLERPEFSNTLIFLSNLSHCASYLFSIVHFSLDDILRNVKPQGSVSQKQKENEKEWGGGRRISLREDTAGQETTWHRQQKHSEHMADCQQ
ncbi:unnamed protein product [Pleuronectes platessa]|uniref:Uncharacterized protein n=1 Tax=Pleuronectes platessa TaxID=8262 RepID=A0A9N7YZJ0_PLEPL|nr:unnamed protein product [Pleuronectes platessa]